MWTSECQKSGKAMDAHSCEDLERQSEDRDDMDSKEDKDILLLLPEVPVGSLKVQYSGLGWEGTPTYLIYGNLLMMVVPLLLFWILPY
jgi:hypothetical protein